MSLTNAIVIVYYADNAEENIGESKKWRHEMVEKITLSELLAKSTPLRAIAGTRSRSSAPSLSIVCTPKNGKRIKPSAGLLEALGNPGHLCFLQVGNQLVVGAELPGAQHCNLAPKGRTLYCAGVIEAIVQGFGLDFTACTSRSFNDVSIGVAVGDDGQEIPVAYINMTTNATES